MAMQTYYAAECDLCQDRSESFHAGIYTKVDAWQILRDAGWSRRDLRANEGLTYRCPSCSSNAFPGTPAPEKTVQA